MRCFLHRSVALCVTRLNNTKYFDIRLPIPKYYSLLLTSTYGVQTDRQIDTPEHNIIQVPCNTETVFMEYGEPL